MRLGGASCADYGGKGEEEEPIAGIPRKKAHTPHSSNHANRLRRTHPAHRAHTPRTHLTNSMGCGCPSCSLDSVMR